MLCLGILRIFSDCCSKRSKTTKEDVKKVATPYQVLGVCEDATHREVKRAYIELMKMYHPDNYQSVNDCLLKEEMEEKSKLINWAYQEVKRSAS